MEDCLPLSNLYFGLDREEPEIPDDCVEFWGVEGADSIEVFGRATSGDTSPKEGAAKFRDVVATSSREVVSED